MTQEAQHELSERFLKASGAQWGYGPGEIVQSLLRYESGKYRCARCNLYNVTVSEVSLKPGEQFPVCDNCKKINKSAQWYPVCLRCFSVQPEILVGS